MKYLTTPRGMTCEQNFHYVITSHWSNVVTLACHVSNIWICYYVTLANNWCANVPLEL